MEVVLNHYKIDPRIDEALRLGEAELIPLLQQIPGFIAHYTVDVGNDEGFTITICDNEASANQALQTARDFVQKHVIPALGTPYDTKPLGHYRGRVRTLHDRSGKQV